MKPTTTFIFISVFFLTACNSNHKKTSLINENASLFSSFKFSNAGLKMTASFIDKKSGSMSVLYIIGGTRTLITWKQKSDKNWFGADVPDRLLSVEEVKTEPTADYKNYNGRGLLMANDTAWQKRRIKYILGLQPSILP